MFAHSLRPNTKFTVHEKVFTVDQPAQTGPGIHTALSGEEARGDLVTPVDDVHLPEVGRNERQLLLL